MPQIDILLNSTANTGGFDKTSAKSRELQSIFDRWGNSVFVPVTNGLQNVERSAQRTTGTLDSLFGRLQQRFSGKDFLESMVNFAGIGSGFAVAEAAIGKLMDHYAEIERRTKEINQGWTEISEKMMRTQLSGETPLDKRARIVREAREAEEELARVETYLKQQRQKALSYTVTERENPSDPGVKVTRERTAAQAEKTETVQTAIKMVQDAHKANEEAKAALRELNAQDREQTKSSTDNMRDATEKETQAAIAARQKTEQSLKSLARTYREMGDPFLSYKQQIAQVEALMKTFDANGKPFLSAQEGADAIKRIKFEMAGGFAPVIEAGRDALHGFANELAKINGDHWLTDEQRRAQRIELLKKENAEIEKQIVALKKLIDANPGKDTKRLQNEVQQLGDRRDANLIDIENNPLSRINAARQAASAAEMGQSTKHYQSAGEGVEGGLLGYVERFGTMADQIAAGIENTIGAAVDGITQGIMGWVNGTMTFGQALRNIGSSVLQAMLQTIIQMGAQWLINAALMKMGLISVEATGDALRAGRVAKENAAEAATLPAKTAGAAASGISSFGAALAFGVLAVALIASLAGGFADGGFTTKGPKMQPAGVVHAGEWVAPQWMVNHPTVGPMIAGLEAMRQGSPGFFNGGLFGRLLDPLGAWRGGFDAQEFFDPLGAITKPREERNKSTEPERVADSQGERSSGARHYFLFDRAEWARMMQEDSEGWFHDMTMREQRRNG